MRRVSFITIAAVLVAGGCRGQVASLGGPEGPGGTATAASTTPPIVIPKGALAQSNKVDLLLMIDNSASMGDKQELLRKSIPDLVTRLVAPNCIGAHGDVVGRSEGGVCLTGTLEFAPVADLHVGILTSSLGGRGGDVCATDSPGINDRAHLVTRTSDGSPLPDAAASGFITFGPGGITDPQRLQSDITALVGGVRDGGCGIEAQLESWYRFLVQPDPYEKVFVGADGAARLEGIDADILKQRHDFLRPDSLLSLLVLTDEDDAAVDPVSVRGQGWAFAAKEFPGSPTHRGAMGAGTTAPRSTSACDATPLSPECSSCGYLAGCTGGPSSPGPLPTSPDIPCDVIENDARCAQSAFYNPEEDELNTRFFQMKRRFGVDPQFPLYRYVHGLLSAKVPSSVEEHDADGKYVGKASCTNPIYAATLPASAADELCTLPEGDRSQRLVVLSVIAGAPPDLLHPGMSANDWTAVLGKDPMAYDFDGIDLHMVQSIAPRVGLPPPTAPDAADPVHGRERETWRKDLQFACTFALDTPRECVAADPACDCAPGAVGEGGPICSVTAPTIQIRAKAYPGIRPLQLARLLGDNAVASSICPASVLPETSPAFAYRTAMGDFGNRLALSLVPAAR